MPGFDDALERLVIDPAFATALATDPDHALAGYTLSPDEAALLRSQISTGTSDTGHSTVESRTNQSSLFGLFGDIFPTADGAPAGGIAGAPAGSSAGGAGFGPGPAADSGFGPAVIGSGSAGSGSAGSGPAGFGPAGSGSAGSGAVGFGPAGSGPEMSLHGTGPGALPSDPTTGFGTADDRGFGDATTQFLGEAPPPVPDGYRTRVDADGDGTWDPHSVRGRPGRGVEILADRDGDGRTDFTGHDIDADGLIDHAGLDTDHDGIPDIHLTDTDGDGWLDTPTPPRS
ncbi:hypothetical protein J2S43_006061 [Catenuloplanes nepalensis]|uniref:Uncharacterized protein n=1 Tax=Catenuloplanes nepalensis TaxID=587533 RepID=A0ABT9N1I1_9ACTN|nr:hypothetical protein [Catenuloplanes nepalensis]MDP9797549.1 hypothetical protein [Catenuloplanes nepalensis]